MNTTKIGILGGGQLGRMLVEAAHRLNLKVEVLDHENCPAKQLLPHSKANGSFNSQLDIKKLADVVDVLTVEIEHVDSVFLEKLEESGKPVHPSSAVLHIIRDKYQQKLFYAKNNIPVGAFEQVSSIHDLKKVAEKFGFPFMLKSKTLAYDGRGNYAVNSANDLEVAFETLGTDGKELYAEKWVPFKKELAVMVAKSINGDISSYPCVETVQKDNICHLVICPAQISGIIATRAQKIAENIVSQLPGCGIFGVELFLCEDDSVLVNEIAPRPHNSGHYTIEACHTSQFEQHLRCILGLPLGSTNLKVPAAVMINIIGATGDNATKKTFQPCFDSLLVPGATVHLYGKSVRAGRKMGHITIVGENISEILEYTCTLTKSTGDWRSLRPKVGIIMGSDSDLPTVKPCAAILEAFGVPFEIDIVSAHRTPERMCNYAKTAHERGIQVIIAAAGGAAHLPGMVAAQTPLPVIGIPVALKYLDGVDSLHSIVQMPRGVPVATVAINNAVNAGLLAIRILGASSASYQKKLMDYARLQEAQVMEKVAKLSEVGWEKYSQS